MGGNVAFWRELSIVGTLSSCPVRPLSRTPAEVTTPEAVAQKSAYGHSSLPSGFEPLLIVRLPEACTAL